MTTELTSELTWDDLVLPHETLEQLEQVSAWLTTAAEADPRLVQTRGSGFRALFHGPSGTGKTLAATLIGQRTGRPVHREDMSILGSDYIGETEKNLGLLFDRAEAQNWILFLDEADALFASRGSTSSTNDRHANQAVPYLLQRIEEFSGLVILAANLRSNIDDAFARRFQLTIGFSRPDATMRLRIWELAVSKTMPVAPSVDLADLAHTYETTAGEIMAALRAAARKVNARQDKEIEAQDILDSLK